MQEQRDTLITRVHIMDEKTRFYSEFTAVLHLLLELDEDRRKKTSTDTY